MLQYTGRVDLSLYTSASLSHSQQYACNVGSGFCTFCAVSTLVVFLFIYFVINLLVAWS